MLKWRIGEVTVTRIPELESPTSPRFLFGRSKREIGGIGWLKPHFATDEGYILLSIHALVIESQGQRIIVDTCLGNDKRRAVPGWGMRNGPFLHDLAGAGYPRERIDCILCTHLHVDHVGWNTMLVDGNWVPTFPNARYLFARKEWDYWRERGQQDHGPVVDDSIQPIFDAGLAELVEMDHWLTDEVWLEPTPGHTPGHVSVHIRSRGEEAVITGDMTHHPCQMARPEWAANADYDPIQSTATRHQFYSRYADQPVLIIGTHFAAPTAGRIVRDGDAYRFAVD